MGEATYYLKARFEPRLSQTEIDNQVQQIKEFFDQGDKARNWWQNHRREEDSHKFWAEFKEKFPRVFKYLKTCTDWSTNKEETDNNNWPAGLLDFGNPEYDEVFFKEEDGVLKISAYVWHCADWNPLRDFLLKEYSIFPCKWISDEHIEPFDLLEV